MRRSRFNDEQIIGILEEQKAGAKVAELSRRHGIGETTFDKWKSKYGGLEVSDAKRLKALEELACERRWSERAGERNRLKKLFADAMLDNAALQGLTAKHSAKDSASDWRKVGDKVNRQPAENGFRHLIRRFQSATVARTSPNLCLGTQHLECFHFIQQDCSDHFETSPEIEL